MGSTSPGSAEGLLSENLGGRWENESAGFERCWVENVVFQAANSDLSQIASNYACNSLTYSITKSRIFAPFIGAEGLSLFISIMKRLKLVSTAILFACLISSCSHRTEDEYIRDAKAAESSQNFNLPISLYKELIEQYPKGAHVEEANFQIASVYNNDLHDPANAARSYVTFFTSYPQSDRSPTAMFLAAFLYNNEMHNTDSARIIYTSFLAKYPTDKLAESAHFELETLGKDPTAVLKEDILPKNQDSVSVENAPKQEVAKARKKPKGS
jgi:hypothetical protein